MFSFCFQFLFFSQKLPDNTDCAEIEELVEFCDEVPTVIVPIGEWGDSPGRVGAGGLYAVGPNRYGVEYEST